MPWFTKKERRMQVSAFLAVFKADFGRFWRVQPFSGLFRPYRLPADTTRYGRYGLILAESARFGANRSRFGTNWAASARIEPSRRESEKKKKNADAVRRAGNRVPHRAASDAGAAPLVPRLCFLDHYHHCYLRRIKERKFKFNCFIQCLWTHFKKSRFLFQHLKIGEEFS